MVPVLFLCIMSVLHVYAASDISVIAVVNGENIFYQDIKVDPKNIQQGSLKILDPARLEEAVYEAEKGRLAAEILEKIKMQKIIELGLTVSEEEVDFELERKFKIGGIDEKKADEMNKMYQALANALESWQKDPLKGDAIYEEQLATYMNKAQWNAFQVSYDTAEKIIKMRSLIPTDLNDMKRQSKESSQKDVLLQKLQDVITSNVSVSDEEIETYYQQKYGHLSEKPRFNDVGAILHQELQFMKKQDVEAAWWKKQYEKSVIEIKDPRFTPKNDFNQTTPVP
jgi:hypothetical protein